MISPTRLPKRPSIFSLISTPAVPTHKTPCLLVSQTAPDRPTKHRISIIKMIKNRGVLNQEVIVLALSTPTRTVRNMQVASLLLSLRWVVVRHWHLRRVVICRLRCGSRRWQARHCVRRDEAFRRLIALALSLARCLRRWHIEYHAIALMSHHSR